MENACFLFLLSFLCGLFVKTELRLRIHHKNRIFVHKVPYDIVEVRKRNIITIQLFRKSINQLKVASYESNLKSFFGKNVFSRDSEHHLAIFVIFDNPVFCYCFRHFLGTPLSCFFAARQGLKKKQYHYRHNNYILHHLTNFCKEIASAICLKNSELFVYTAQIRPISAPKLHIRLNFFINAKAAPEFFYNSSL